jgi:CheY-like chemotaxis protein
VSDTGIGIAPDLLPRVFDLFAQENRGLDRSQGGLGIGLTLVRYLVELHGGSVEARSEGPNCGSEFIVRLQAVSPPVASASAMIAEPVSPKPPGSGRVLVVEDQADVRDSLRLVLEGAGYQVFEAVDGPGAIEAVERVRPAAAIVDIGLPGFDGYEVAKRVRQLPGGPTMLLVALTGYGQPLTRRRAQEAGFDLHLIKPVSPAQIQELLRSARPNTLS